jgi:hypothetical protein
MTPWWNEKVNEAVQKNKIKFKTWIKNKHQDDYIECS